MTLLRRESPASGVRVSQPRHPREDWKVVVEQGEQHFSIYWHAWRGFEIFTQANDCGAGPELLMRMRLLLARAANPRMDVPMSQVDSRRALGAPLAHYISTPVDVRS